MLMQTKIGAQTKTLEKTKIWTQIKILTKLELCNLYGLNTFRFSRDKKAKRKFLGLFAAWALVAAMLVFYVGGLTYGLIYLGLEEVVPAYLITISSLLIFAFGMLKEGSIIFRREGYDILCALPVNNGGVVVSRLIRIYVENLLMTLAVLLPGIAVYVWNLHPGAGFYVTALLGIWSIPFLPMTAALFIGTLITGISSRMRHKSLIAAILSVLTVLGILYGSSRLSSMEGNIEPEMLKKLSASVMGILGKVYPPAVWLGANITQGNIWGCALCAALSLAVFAAAGMGVSLCYQKICQGLYSSAAKHNYKMGTLKAGSVLSSLCMREFKRYFSSSIYVTNTIIGPVMACVFCAALLFTGIEKLKGLWLLPFDIEELIPFGIAGTFCMMTTTSTSISLEGKSWWIVKSLPLSVKNILDAKILMNLLLLLPFYLLSELFLLLALKPDAQELLWLLLIPAAIILFSCVYGITVNLYFPVLEWENEVRIVKQSASAMLGGMGGFILAILCAVAAAAVPKAYTLYLKAGICAVLLAAAAVLYKKNNRFDILGKI